MHMYHNIIMIQNTLQNIELLAFACQSCIAVWKNIYVYSIAIVLHESDVLLHYQL